MFKKEKLLKKEYLTKKYYERDIKDVYLNKTNFINFLNEIEEEFYNHDFKKDNRYVLLGRHKFLIKEMEELYYTKEQCKELHLDTCPTVWCLSSLIEIMCMPNFLSLIDYEKLKNINEVYSNKEINECRQIHDSYNKDNIISLNERDYILHALNMIKDSLDKCDDNLEWK